MHEPVQEDDSLDDLCEEAAHLVERHQAAPVRGAQPLVQRRDLGLAELQNVANIKGPMYLKMSRLRGKDIKFLRALVVQGRGQQVSIWVGLT